MGGGPIYDGSITRGRISSAERSGRSYMGHSARVERHEVEAKVHPKLNPKALNSAGKNVREAFDLPEHPNSVPVAVIFDTTGSMRSLPELFVKQLPKLMELIRSKGYLSDPQLLFGAVNDATTYPIAALEVGQFESGNQMDDVITNILLQGGGGNGVTESYELVFYYMARHTDLDSVKKRNKKGYLFIIGDEIPYSSVNVQEVKEWIGDDLQANIPTPEIVAELKQKFDVYWLFPTGAANSDNQSAQKTLQDLFGQNFLRLKKPEEICLTIAATIAISEGRDPRTVASDLKAAEGSSAEIQAIVDSIPPRRLDDI